MNDRAIKAIARLGISAAAHRLSHVWWGRVLVILINALFLDRDHCRKAHAKQEAEKGTMP